MSIIEERVAPAEVGDAGQTQELESAPPPEPDVETRLPPVNALITSAAVFLAASSAGWMCAGIFTGTFPKLVAFIGPLIGAGMVALSYQTRRPSVIQYLALPVAAVAGAVLVIPDATGGTANLPGLVQEAIRSGGVAQPPIPFDPGWRFVLVVLTAMLAAAGASLATGTNRPKLGVFFPAPLIFAAALVQPKEGTLATTAVALVLLIGSLGLAYGAELQREGATSGSFELRRFGRAGIVIVLLVGVLWALSQAGFLFPETDRDQVIPPKRPESQPPQRDRIVFSVRSDRPGPWRLGVLDVYQDNAWMLPPYDTSRFQEIPPSGLIPTAERGADAVPPSARRSNDDAKSAFEATFTVADIEGHVLPSITEASSIERDNDFGVSVDPRTGMLRLPNSRARRGMRYRASAPLPPTGAQMSKAPQAPPEFADVFTDAPPAPAEVLALLDQAPRDNLFERLQFVRNAFYEKVIAAGSGQPADLPPTRVVEMLAGGEATPYEITAAEALLARWAEVPSRIGYGYYAGELSGAKDNTYDVRPKHGSTWLEAYFHSYGWVPILGTPPRAKSTLNEAREQEKEIRPTEELALVVYVPVEQESVRLLFVVVRYWALVTLPLVVGFAILWGFYPGVIKVVRRYRRRRWAGERGVPARIAVAYAEFRDACNDLNVGHESVTPLEYLDSIEPDDEHRELAWLVTRTLWGDLMRDLRPEDAEAAEDLSSSIVRRLRRAASAVTRLLAFGSRASLREPYTAEIPNLWPSWARPGVVRSAIRRRLAVGTLLRRARRLVPFGSSVLLLAIALTTAACGQNAVTPAAELTAPVLPNKIVPAKLLGLDIEREKEAEIAYEKAGDESLVATGRVYTLRDGEDVKGALQVGALKPGLKATEREIREGLLGSIGSGDFELTRIGQERIFVQRGSEQGIFLWFPPRMHYFEIFVARRGFDEADRYFTSVLAFQRGDEFDIARRESQITDPRRGPLE